MLKVQKSYQAMLRALNGDRDFIDIANENISSLPLKKQIECIVCALGEHSAKIRESAPSASANTARQQAIQEILPFIDDAICLVENKKYNHALEILTKGRAKLLPC